MLEADLLGRVKVVEKLPGDVELKDRASPDGFAPASVQLAEGDKIPAYEPIKFPLIENTPGLPEAVGAFHDPVFARDAFEFLDAKNAMTMDEYVALAQDYRARAFTMSGVENTELLTSVKDALAEVVKSGGTRADFQKAAAQAFEDFGVTGPEPGRLNLVFDTNVAQAYSDGQWDQVHEEGVLDAFPFFRYHTRGDDRVRLNHAWMNGRVYASGDPIWDEWFPPNGFRCRCWIEFVSRYEVEQKGIVADVERPFMHPDEGFGIGEKEGP